MSRGATAEAVAPGKRFGPSALMTPANGLSMVRVVAAPLFGILAARTGPSSWLLWVLWTVLAVSDRADGQLARRHGVTRSGAFLDPLADKLLVLSALCALGALGYFSWWPIALITVRELAMNVFRTWAGSRGVSVPARLAGKIKTLVQDFAIGFAFFPPIGAHVALVPRVVLWVAVVLTLYSGYEYARDARRTLHG